MDTPLPDSDGKLLAAPLMIWPTGRDPLTIYTRFILSSYIWRVCYCAVRLALARLLLSSVEKAELQQCCYCCGSSKSWDSEWKQVKLVGVARRGVGGGEAQYRLPRLGSGGGGDVDCYARRLLLPSPPPPDDAAAPCLSSPQAFYYCYSQRRTEYDGMGTVALRLCAMKVAAARNCSA